MNTVVTGQVVIGDGRGQALGFPTANLQLDEGAERPPDGIYAAWVEREGQLYMGAVHVGPVPTFGKHVSTVEVHLLDFPDQDLYGESLTVSFVQRINDVKKMNSVPELQQRIQENCDQARKVLSSNETP